MPSADKVLKGYMSGWQKYDMRRCEGICRQIDMEAEICFLNTPGQFNYLQAPVMEYIRDLNRFKNGRLMVLTNRRLNDEFRAVVMISDDLGQTWDTRYVHKDADGRPDIGMCTSLIYLGEGRLLMHYTNYYSKKPDEKQRSYILASSDWGNSWEIAADFPSEEDGREFYLWSESLYADTDTETGRVTRIIASGYRESTLTFEEGGSSIAGIRSSYDSGLTWTKTLLVPEWYGYNEVTIIKAPNGDLIAALRKDMPKRFRMSYFDNLCGMGISRSTDGGADWSEVVDMYEWGRHFSSMVVLPDGDVLMTYIVRLGYPATEKGYPQFGLEAIISHDSAMTWDYDNRYVLADWEGSMSGPLSWLSGTQNTSTKLLPDGSLMTVFGSGARARPDPDMPVWGAQMDTVLIHWRLDKKGKNICHDDMPMTNALPFSDIRNKVENRPGSGAPEKWLAANRNIAVPAYGAKVYSSSSDLSPSKILYDRFLRNFLTLETIPAWIEIEWPVGHSIDEIHIHPGAPQLWNEPKTECVPLDYELFYWKGGWVRLIPPVTDAKRYDGTIYFLISKCEFEYIHSFPPVKTNRIRMEITRSSDSGKRSRTGELTVVPPGKRKTILRLIEVMENREEK
jgi:hypothetical protein